MKLDYDIDAERMANRLSKRIYNEPLEKIENNLTIESIESLDDE